MSPDTSNFGSRQQVRANTYPSPFEDFTINHGTEVAWQTEESSQNDRHIDTPSAPSHRPFQSDFDIRNEFWPSSAHALRQPSSSLPSNLENQNQNLPDQPTSPLPQRNEMALMIHQDSNLYDAPRRLDLFARNSLREMILYAVLSETLGPLERISLLDDCKDTAESSNLGIPFRETLSEPMEHLGVSPLMYEIMSCQPDWDGTNDPTHGSGLEMVLYLIENWIENVLVHGKMGVCMNVVRTACLRRFDGYEGNRLFQFLRPIVAQSQSKEIFDYDISIAPLGSDIPDNKPFNLDFTALISLPHFASRQKQPCPEIPSSPVGRKPSLSAASTYVSVEFLAARRAWRLKVDGNMLALELLDGPSDTIPSDSYAHSAPLVDARVKIIMPERSDAAGSFASTSSAKPDDLGKDAPIELFLPRSRLRPVAAAGSGSSEAKLSPCFCSAPGEYDTISGLDDARLLHDGRGALLLELTVRFGQDASGFTFVDVRSMPSQHIESASEPRPSQNANIAPSVVSDDDLYVPSEVALYVRTNEMTLADSPEESEWEEISQVDETEAQEGGWIKASWSGRDEEL